MFYVVLVPGLEGKKFDTRKEADAYANTMWANGHNIEVCESRMVYERFTGLYTK